ncbi:helix-turn-helix domain-containing protein [Lactococcus petauri]|uniref:helix-turn-helix domain-containing protein n=1 Tax=Lactococcus petauri TaxID=1940789 RepID=UPI00254AE5DB|nr:helix-turn-helix transcriptional regulator [Lactococcus petauri]
MTSISQNLIGLRRARNMERKEVCEALGLLPTSYARYETGLRVPDIELLGKFARYYNVTIDYLTGQTDLVSKEEYFQEVLEMIAEKGGDVGNIACEALKNCRR